MPSQPVRLYQGELTEQNNMGYRVSIVIRMEENLTEQVTSCFMPSRPIRLYQGELTEQNNMTTEQVL